MKNKTSIIKADSFILLLVVLVIGYFIYNVYRKKELQKKEKNELRQELIESKKQYYFERKKFIKSVNEFVQSSFRLKSVKEFHQESKNIDLEYNITLQSSYNNLSSIVFSFINNSNLQIEGLRVNLEIRTNLNTYLFDGDVEINQSVRSRQEIALKYKVEKNLYKYNFSQLKLIASPPKEREFFGTSQNRKSNLRIAGESPFIVFYDGFEIHKVMLNPASDNINTVFVNMEAKGKVLDKIKRYQDEADYYKELRLRYFKIIKQNEIDWDGVSGYRGP